MSQKCQKGKLLPPFLSYLSHLSSLTSSSPAPPLPLGNWEVTEKDVSWRHSWVLKTTVNKSHILWGERHQALSLHSMLVVVIFHFFTGIILTLWSINYCSACRVISGNPCCCCFHSGAAALVFANCKTSLGRLYGFQRFYWSTKQKIPWRFALNMATLWICQVYFVVKFTDSPNYTRQQNKTSVTWKN